jgi:hypothetical protein
VTYCKNARCGKLQNVTTCFVVLNVDLQIRYIESEISVHRGATSYCDKPWSRYVISRNFSLPTSDFSWDFPQEAHDLLVSQDGVTVTNVTHE